MVNPWRPVAVTPDNRPAVEDWRCPHCGALLAKVRLAPGSLVAVKCYRCNQRSALEMG